MSIWSKLENRNQFSYQMASTKPIGLVFNPKYPGKQKITFDFGSIDHHLYGKAEQLYGEFELFHSNGSYPSSTYFDLPQPRQKKLVTDVIHRLGYLYEHLTAEDLEPIVLQGVVATAICLPRLDATTKLFEIAVDFAGIANYVDDSLEDHAVLDDPAFVYKQCMNAVGGGNWKSFMASEEEQASNKETLLNQFPEAQLLWRAHSDLNSQLRQEYPEVSEKDVKPLFEQVFQAVEGSLMGCGESTSCTESKPSERLMLTCRGRDSGMITFFEFSCYIQRYVVTKGIRKTFLFQTFLSQVGEFSGLNNDILGIMKDIGEEGSHKNIILRRVVREGICLQDSFRQAVQTLREIVSDMNIIMDRLIQVFPDEKGIADCINAAKDMCDGQSIGYLYASMYKSRYKQGTVEIAPVHPTHTVN